MDYPGDGEHAPLFHSREFGPRHGKVLGVILFSQPPSAARRALALGQQMNFYESADVKPSPYFFSSPLVSLAGYDPLRCDCGWVPVLPCGERRETQTLSLWFDLMAVFASSLPVLVHVSWAFRLAASERVRPPSRHELLYVLVIIEIHTR